jgi:raffinose/stachyose/melibiose transport system permease protein
MGASLHPRFKNYSVLVIKYFILTTYALTTFVPLWWTFSNSFRNNEQIFTQIRLFPESFDFTNYINVFKSTSIPQAFYNSISITMVSLVGLLVVLVPCAYVLARYRFKGAYLLYMFFALSIFIPNITVLASTFKLYQMLDLYGGKYGIAYTYIAHQLPFCVFLLVSYMRAIPVALEEAAIIDGCRTRDLLLRIILPLSRNGIVTISILSFISIWNDYIYALILLPKEQLRTLTVAAAFAKSEFLVDYGMMSAAVIVTILPVIIIYLVLQDKIINGMAAGSVKG